MAAVVPPSTAGTRDGKGMFLAAIHEQEAASAESSAPKSLFKHPSKVVILNNGKIQQPPTISATLSHRGMLLVILNQQPSLGTPPLVQPLYPTIPIPNPSGADCTCPTSDANDTNNPDHDYISGLKQLPGNTSGNMAPVVAGSSSELQPATEAVLDPISRVLYTYPLTWCSPAHSIMQQILERTQSQIKLPGSSQGGVPSKSLYAESGYSDDQYSGILKPEPTSLRRVDSNNSGKEKK